MTVLLQGAGLQTAAASGAPPLFVSAEVGSVDASTVVVTFDRDVKASENDFLLGVTIKVNGLPVVVTAGLLQVNQAIVYYDLALPIVSSDTVTWEYDASTGIILSETDNAPLADVTAQSVTNHTPPLITSSILLLDLRASRLSLSDGDPVSTWPDASGNGRDFTQTGSARPTYRAGGGVPYVEFDGIDDWMLGSNFADNLNSFAIFMVFNADIHISGYNQPITKVFRSVAPPYLDAGWYLEYENNFYAEEQGTVEQPAGPYVQLSPNWVDGAKRTSTWEIVDIAQKQANYYENGTLIPTDIIYSGNVSNFSNSEPVRLAVDGAFSSGFDKSSRYAILIYAPAPNATDRAAIEAWLATDP